MIDPIFKKRLFEFAKGVITITDRMDNGKNSERILGGQLIRSGTSIVANIIEAQAGRTKKDFINYFHYSLKSANETMFWIKLLIDTNKINSVNGNKLLKEAREISNIIAASILTIKGKRNL